MTIAAESKTSVLASLTAEVMAEKKTAARTLTPLAGEFPGDKALLPNDLPGVFLSNEGMATTAAQLRKHASYLISVADALDVLTGEPTAVEAHEAKTAETAAKLAEREGDRKAAARNASALKDGSIVGNDDDEEPEQQALEREEEADFNADFAAKAAAAQAATFKDVKTDAEVEAEYIEGDWVCPTHGKRTTKRSNKTGREFIGCPDCNQFER